MPMYILFQNSKIYIKTLKNTPTSYLISHLTVWRRNNFFLILAHPVYKMWIKQEPNKLELWNKLHFEEKETESIYHV